MPAKASTKKKRVGAGEREEQPLGSLTTLAYQAVKREILSNRLRPGEPLPLERLIRDLNLSRTPLREAILRLEKEGFVEIKPRMGTFVSHLNLREIQEMYQVRRHLEGLAARLAAERLRPEALEEVETELRRHRLRGEIDYAALSDAGQLLHKFIVDSCGSGVLARFIQSLQDHFTRFRALSLGIPEKIISSHREHLAILDALKRGDGQLAERLIEEHFDNAQRYLLDSLLHNARGQEARPVVVSFDPHR